MDELLSILGVMGLFLLRVGLPIVLLVALGIVIDRWQTRREERIRQYYAPSQEKIIDNDNHKDAESDNQAVA